MTTKTRKAPAKAFSLVSDAACEFGEYKISDRDNEFVARAPITLAAVSGAPFAHWFWGEKVVIDVEGVRTTKDTISLDWCHDRDEIIGMGSAKRRNGSLFIDGELISTVLNDRAHDVMRKGAAGVPYEASVKFDPFNGLKIAEYGPGTTVSVNGREHEGPITVIEECLLRGVAVCPYGSDPGTHSEFVIGDGLDVDVTIFSKGNDMTEQVKDGKAADVATAGKDNASQQAPPPDPAAEFKATLKDYVTRFGAERGAAWATDSKPVTECYSEFVEQLTARHKTEIEAINGELTAAKGRITELESRIAQLGSVAAGGEEKPLSSNPGDVKPEDAEFATRVEKFEKAGMSPGRARFAASIKIQDAN